MWLTPMWQRPAARGVRRACLVLTYLVLVLALAAASESALGIAVAAVATIPALWLTYLAALWIAAGFYTDPPPVFPRDPVGGRYRRVEIEPPAE